MKIQKKIFTLALLLASGVLSGFSQEKKLTDAEIAALQGHGSAYVNVDPRQYIKDPKVLQKLEEWQDLKFGFMVHWGPYSQWEIDASWSLCQEKDWGRSKNPKWAEAGKDIDKYRQMYWDLNKTFNPVNFKAKKWAELAKKAGMKYFVFTTMHHDGFCMFDSKFTDYKITGKDCPYSANPKADVTKELFNEFRNKGFVNVVYYSKPSWHNENFWIKDQPKPFRNANYDVTKEPERWEKFVKFTHNQIDQLLSDYGKVDVLWLDGGWVNPDNKNQSIRMNEIAANGRKKQPGLIVVDRTIHGEFENFATPEQQIPKEALNYPWETNMTMGKIWAYRQNEEYKPTIDCVHKLIDVVSKGGNFLLNLGPTPDGWFHPTAVKQMNEIGEWMDVNGEAIYATRAIAPFKEGDICYTRKKNTNDVYAICLVNEKQTEMPAEVVIPSFQPKAGGKVTLLGSKTALKWTKSGKGTTITIPQALRKNPPAKYAWAFKMTIK